MLDDSGKRSDDRLGLTVNTVTPVLIATELVAAVPEKVIDKLKAQIPDATTGPS